MYLSLYVMLLVVKATTMLYVNVTVCNTAAIMLLSLYIYTYVSVIVPVCNATFSKSHHYAVV